MIPARPSTARRCPAGCSMPVTPGPGPGAPGRRLDLALGRRTYDLTHRALVMGILNRTPDSFYDRGATFALDAFFRRADQLVAEGADLLDVGGVKAGPGPEVTEAEELDRVVPAIEALATRFDVPLSVDTWRASVARAAYGVGAVVGNDISGFADPDYLPAAAEAGASVVATHIRLAPRVRDPDPAYDDVVADVRAFLVDRAARARGGRHPGRPGDPRRRARPGQDGRAVARPCCGPRPSLAGLGHPLLLSASNKTFLGVLLDLELTDRRRASLSAAALGIAAGCRVLRVHDVAGTRRVATPGRRRRGGLTVSPPVRRSAGTDVARSTWSGGTTRAGGPGRPRAPGRAGRRARPGPGGRGARRAVGRRRPRRRGVIDAYTTPPFMIDRRVVVCATPAGWWRPTPAGWRRAGRPAAGDRARPGGRGRHRPGRPGQGGRPAGQVVDVDACAPPGTGPSGWPSTSRVPRCASTPAATPARRAPGRGPGPGPGNARDAGRRLRRRGPTIGTDELEPFLGEAGSGPGLGPDRRHRRRRPGGRPGHPAPHARGRRAGPARGHGASCTATSPTCSGSTAPR